jgi:hypothetical protein
MTYSNASAWVDNHIPKDDFNCFEEWLNHATVESQNGLQTSELLNEPDYVNDMKEYWLDEVGRECRDEEEEPQPPSDQVLVSTQSLDEIAQQSGIKIIYSSQPVQIGSQEFSQVSIVRPEIPRIEREGAPIITPQKVEAIKRITLRERITGFFRRFRGRKK